MTRPNRILSAVGTLAVTVLVTTTACSGSGNTKKDQPNDGKLSIALSNSYIGNQWRIEMGRPSSYSSAASTCPYPGC